MATKPSPELPARDQLMTRPDAEALPTAEDPKKPRGEPADPKPAPPTGQGTDPKADQVDYTA